jgi:cephalosporin hydroxylase
MLQSQWEFSQLLDLYLKAKPKKVLEIGVKFGGTLRKWIERANPDTTIVAVDDCRQVDYSLTNQAYADLKGIKLIFIKGDSHSESVINLVNHHGPYDFVFIDGDHTYDGVRADWENFGNSSVVAFHDIVPHEKEIDQGPSILWQEIKPYHATREFVEDWDSNFGGIGVVFQLEPEYAIMAA